MIVKGKEMLRNVPLNEKLPAFITFKREGSKIRIIIIPAEFGPHGELLELIYPDRRIIIEEKLE